MIESVGKVPLISIIDDDASIRISISGLVRTMGFDARSFETADEYLQSPERHETACIVSDIQLPGTNGLDLQRQLAVHVDRTPIIFITAFPRPEIRKRALDAGAVCFLTKPFDAETLIDCIKLALKRRQEETAVDRKPE